MRASRIEKTRACVASLRAALLQPEPEALEARIPSLSEAIEGFSALARFASADAPGDGGGPARADLGDLRALALDLAACRKLIEHGLAATQVLGAILAGANAGYSSTGSPPALSAQTTLSVRA